MKVTATLELELPSCNCTAPTCQHRPELHHLTATGWAWQSSKGWSAELVRIEGLPDGMTRRDLSLDEEDRVCAALERAAQDRSEALERLPDELKRVALSLHHIAERPTPLQAQMLMRRVLRLVEEVAS